MESIKQWHENGGYLNINGHQIFYRSQLQSNANKPVLLLVHGFPTCSWDWAKIWDSLAARFQLVTLDLLGFGYSDKPAQDYSIMDQADICEAVLTHLNVTQFHVLAHDYGDTVAQELLARHMDDKAIQSITFSNGGLFPETHKPVLIQRLLLSPIGFLISKLTTRSKFAATFSRICAKPILESELDTYWSMLEHNNGVNVMHKLIHYMLERRQYRERWVGSMVASKTPLHLIDGTLDPISGGHMVARYKEIIPNPSVDTLTDTGHYPQVESPEAFVAYAHDFWDTVTKQG